MKNLFVWLVPLLLATSLPAFSQKASISESWVSFKTYPFSDPDPVAKITHFYPNYRFDGFTNDPIEKQWKIVTLENPYIKVYVAPEMGGKVLGAIDKASGEEFIYFNKVVKFRDIAMRGAWTSGGIEFNFGSIGHAPTTASPVNYLLRENPDGSVSCFTGAPDIASRTEWRVEIRLQPDKSYFETNALWYNPSDLNTSLYNWTTASVDVSDDLEYYFPGDTEIGHVGETGSWPINSDGVDISKYPNNSFGGPKSYHVLGEYADYFLCYFRDKKFGLGHWAPYDEKPGKKIWLWALSREGEIWKDLLTDSENKQYTEIQTGFLFNQASPNSTLTPYKHQYFNAGSEHKFTELWFPVKDIGGMVKANAFGSLNVETKAGKVYVGFCANQDIDEEMTVVADGKVLALRQLKLKPTETFTEVLANDARQVEVRIGDLLHYSTTEKEARHINKPRHLSENYDWNSVDALFLKATEDERQRNYTAAREAYLKVLENDSFHLGALTKLGGLSYRSMHPGQALEYLMKAISVDVYYPEANYLLGLVYRNQKQYYKALEAFSMAARAVGFKGLAYEKMADIYFLQKEYAQSLRYSEQAIDYDRNNINALKIQALVYERTGESQKRESVLDRILEIDPLNAFARFEKKDEFSKVLNFEQPQQLCLELAIAYYKLGCNEKAAEVLKAVEPAPIANYWLAFLLGDNSYLDKALTGSPSLVFPSRSETADVLEWAETQKPSWKTKYYLALLHWSKGNEAEADNYFEACNNESGYAAFYLTRYNFTKNKDANKGENDLQKAFKLDPNNWRIFLALSDFYQQKKQFAQALIWAEKGAKLFPENFVLAYQKAKELVISGDYNDALKLLRETLILPNEGARAGRVVWRQAALMSALDELQNGKYSKAKTNIQQARQWPENLGVGKPYGTDERIEDFLESRYWEKKGNSDKVRQLEQQIVDFTRQSKSFSPATFLGALLMKKAGDADEAKTLLQNWKNSEPENPVAAWSYEKLFGNEMEAAGWLDRIVAESGGSLMDPEYKNYEFGLVLALSTAFNE